MPIMYDMDYTILGRTGLRVSVMGLGGGGFSRLGTGTGVPRETSLEIVHRAVDLGVNFLDTAELYGTEPLIGEALREIGRERVVLSTKKTLSENRTMINGAELTWGLERSLSRLGTDYVDIYHLHAVAVGEYDYAREELVPALVKLRDQGKIRYLGVTEHFGAEPTHAMLERAVNDDVWDVIMVGFNILNQSARRKVLAEAMKRGIGVLCMFAVRNAFSRPDRLREIVRQLAQEGNIDPNKVDLSDPLGFVTRWEGVGSLPEAAYRFCRAEPGINVVLSGTGNLKHLEENIAAILKPPLPDELHRRLVELFGQVDSVSGQ